MPSRVQLHSSLQAPAPSQAESDAATMTAPPVVQSSAMVFHRAPQPAAEKPLAATSLAEASPAPSAPAFDLPQTQSPDAPAPAEAPAQAAAVTVAHEITEASERMRASGAERVEIQVRLHGGEEVTVRLHLRDGAVQATVKTDNEPLRQALEENWNRLAPNAADRTVRVNTPIFEAASARGSSQDFTSNQQQQQQRRSTPDEPVFTDGTPALRRPAPRSGTPAARPAAVQLYA